MSSIKLYIGGNKGNIPAAALGEALIALVKMLKSVGGRNVTIQNLEMGSASAVLESEATAVESIETGLAALTNGDPVPVSWGADTLKLVSNLYENCQYKTVSTVKVGKEGKEIPVSKLVSSAAKRILAEGNRALSEYLGGVTGRLYRINLRNVHSPDAGIETPNGSVVRAVVPEELIEGVSRLVGKEVSVWGRVTVSDKGDKSIVVEGIEAVPTPSYQKMSVDEGWGLLAIDDLDGMSPVEWVRNYRAS